MIRFALPAAVLFLAACGRNEGVVASDVKPTPALSTMESTPGDWSALGTLTGREPSDSGLLLHSPIVTDLDAMLGASAKPYREAMAPAGTLRREGGLLVSVSPVAGAYLVIDPRQHALAAGMRTPQGWRRWQTPASEIALPREVAALEPA